MRQLLMERREWHLGPNASTENEDAYSRRKALVNNGELLLYIEHGTKREDHNRFHYRFFCAKHEQMCRQEQASHYGRRHELPLHGNVG